MATVTGLILRPFLPYHLASDAEDIEIAAHAALWIQRLEDAVRHLDSHSPSAFHGHDCTGCDSVINDVRKQARNVDPN